MRERERERLNIAIKISISPSTNHIKKRIFKSSFIINGKGMSFKIPSNFCLISSLREPGRKKVPPTYI